MIDSYYAVDHLGSPSCQKTISMVQEQLANDGCSVIRNFFSDDGLNILLREAEECLDYDYCSTKKLCNVYLGNGNHEFPDDHRRIYSWNVQTVLKLLICLSLKAIHTEFIIGNHLSNFWLTV